MRGRLHLKRHQPEPAPEEGKRRASVPPPTQPAATQQVQTDGAAAGGKSWATDFTAELSAGMAAQQAAQQAADADMIVISDSGSEDELDGQGGNARDASPPPSPLGDEAARQGLMKVIDSMRLRLDDGHLQLQRMKRLQQQKQQLVAAGEAVLAEHCRASWRHQQLRQQRRWRQLQLHRLGESAEQEQQQGMSVTEAPAPVVHQIGTKCVGGQWWVQAKISLPAVPAQAMQRLPNERLALLAASPTCSLACSQQQCEELYTSSSMRAAGGQQQGKPALERLRLTAALDVQQLTPGEDAWVDVFLLLEQHAEDPAAAPLASSAAAPPVLLGRVQLSWQKWLLSHDGGRSRIHDCEADGEEDREVDNITLPRPPPPIQHSSRLVVSSQQLDLQQCLHGIITRRLGCVHPENRRGSSYMLPEPEGSARQLQYEAELLRLRQRKKYEFPNPPALATVELLRKGRHFVEVHLEAGSSSLLSVLQQQLKEGLWQAATKAGLPADDISMEKSLLPAEHAQQVAAAASALVSELDASIEWVEALLREKLALDSQQRQHKAEPDAAGVLQRQAAALAAMVATDELMVQLLTG